MGAFAFQLSANPLENFVIGTSYKNYLEDVGTETYTHGDVSAMFSYTKGKMTLDAEYCKATKRGEGEAKPSAYFVSCAYQTNDILELALRYEDFDDDDETTTSTNSKVSYGLNYSIAEGTTLSFEYTKNNLEQGEKDKDEFYAKLAMEF